MMEKDISYDNVHINSLDECLHVIINTFVKDDKLSSIQISKAKKYFEKYLDDFSPKQVIDIFKNPLIKGFTGDFPARAIKYAVKHDMVFPIMFANWFDNLDFNTSKAYLIILNKNNHEEQIRLFCSKDNELKVVHYCLKNNLQPTDALITAALGIDSSLILYNSIWSKDKIDNWFNKNENNFFFIVKKSELFDTKKIPENVKLNILNRLADVFINEEKESDKLNFEESFFIKHFRYFPLDYIKLLENKSPDLLEKILSTEISFEDYTLNAAQYFLESQTYHENGHKNILKFTERYSHLLTCPAKEMLHMYESEIDIFELALRKSMWYLFTPFSSNMNLLNNDQKEKMLVAAFAYISLEFDQPGKKILETWAKNVFLNIDNDIFIKYYNQYKIEKKQLHSNRKKGLKHYDHSLNNELEAISFQKNLDNNLTPKNKNKALKI